MPIPQDLLDPPRLFSVMPFWFWNDRLDEAELVRQIQDFEAHGVYGFVIHPRVGLPRDLGWMSDKLLDYYALALREAERRGMCVVLYDEGMYPSGSSSGQVVAANPAFRCRGLVKVDLADGQEPQLGADAELVAIVRRRDGQRMTVINRPVDAYLRGLHYVGEGPEEDEPPAADILNPAAVATFIRCVYDRFAERFAAHLGRTIIAVFTDEPGLLGKCRERGVWPGTRGMLGEVNRLLGCDFTPHLAALWYDDEPEAARWRAAYQEAVQTRLEETYYASLSAWCTAHGLALTGHPAQADDLGAQRFFHIPGQDLVWRWVLPDHPSALEGPQSTQAKATSSAMLHLGRQRNANECCGAYGHALTWDEMVWLAHWCFVRGVNLLYPHAFYYAVRGPRRHERPPDVGPHAPWWPRYRAYADACRRLSWLNNAASRHVCQVAILGKAHWLPWCAAQVCYQHQWDFNYLEERHLWEDARVDGEGIHLRSMHYCVLVVEGEPDPRAADALATLEAAGRLIRYSAALPDTELVRRLAALTLPDIQLTPHSPGLRVRHMACDALHVFLLFNEVALPWEGTLRLPVAGPAWRFDPWTGACSELPEDARLALEGHQLQAILAGAT